MKKKKLSIYANPKRYARKCNIPIELAKIECRRQKTIAKKRKKIKCPICKRKRLAFIHGSYEEGHDAFLECGFCGETYDPHEIRNSDLLCFGNDFDAVLYFSGGRTAEERAKYRMEAIGEYDDASWVKFAERMIKNSNE